MRWSRIIGLGLLCELVLAGCGDGRLAKDIAAQRKSGDVAGARQKALDALAENAARMTVWRELAYCDEMLGRDGNLSNTERLHYLVEASLLSGAICSQHDGQPPDDPWKAVCVLLQQDLDACLKATMGGVKIHFFHEPVKPRQHQELNERAFDPLNPVVKTYSSDRYEAEPAEAEAAVWVYGRLKPLRRQLLSAVTDDADWQEETMRELAGWVQRWQIPQANATTIYETGERAVARASERAREDLQDPGYFQVSTIVKHGILEP